MSSFFVPYLSAEEDYFIQTAEAPDGYTYQQKVELSARVLPHPRQMIWFDDEYAGFIHYGPNTFSGVEWGTGFEAPTLFNPTFLDTDQWCEVMSDAGMKRVVLVAKHHEGYVLWQSRYTEHSVASSPWLDGQGDVVRQVADSCRKYGLKLGIYLSPADLFQIESPGGYYGNGSEFRDRVIPRPVEGRPFEDPRTFTYSVDDYNEYFLNQLFELLTEFGPIYEVWLDGANPKPGTGQTYSYEAWYDLVRQLAPDAVIFGKGPDVRWIGNEGGRTREAEYSVIPYNQWPYDSEWPDLMDENLGGRDKITEDTRYFHYYPAESNTSIRHGWFWRNDDEQQVRSTENVFDIYERSVGGNSVFLLNIPPNPEGSFSARDVQSLQETGRKIREVYGHNVFDGASSTAVHVLDNNRETWWEAPALEAEIEILLPEKRTINRLMIQEAIAHRGERVDEHHLEAFVDDEWIVAARGKNIGNKRILRFPEVESDRFRLAITQSRLNPAIAHLSAHYYDEPPRPVSIRRTRDGRISLSASATFSWNHYESFDSSQQIYYTLDGSEPTASSQLYTEELALPSIGGHLKARSISGDREGPVSEYRFGIDSREWEAWVGEHESQDTHPINLNRRWTFRGEGSKFSYTLLIDMKETYAISGFTYTPHPEGFIESYQVEISSNGDEWQELAGGSFGNIRNDPSTRTVLFESPITGRYLRFVNLMAPGGEETVGASAIHILP